MDTNKNTYTVIYATVLVVLVAAILAFASNTLKSRQQRNIEIEKKQNILKSVALGEQAQTVKDKDSYIEQEYSKYIQESSVSENGEELPIFICTFDNGEKAYILPVKGVGLWGPIWGYVSLKSDLNTIYGATFDHKGETPGLGAEIATAAFSSQFAGKQIFENGEFTSVQVVKGGAKGINQHEVDAISGGTITSKGLEEMLKVSLGKYLNYFKSTLAAADTTTVNNN